MKNILNLIVLLILAINISCNKTTHQNADFPIIDGKYDSEFPNRPTSKELEKIAESIKLLSSFSVYNVYSFDENTPQILLWKNPEKYAFQTYVEEKPSNGTATIIYNNDGLIGLLTCAHIIDDPDTLIKYFDDENDNIKSIHILERQSRIIVDIDDFQDFEVFAIDKELDIALIGKRIPLSKNKQITVFPFKTGKASELNWGTFTYIFGYPKGKKILSKAVVSGPNRNKSHAFLLDASQPRGISGGIVLALRDGPPNFEMVGMINAIDADFGKILVPDRRADNKYDRPGRPYAGNIYTKLIPTISYGIQYAISMESILGFLKKNKKTLQTQGFKMDNFFKTNPDR